MPDLRLTARARDRLTDEETIRLGRVLVTLSPRSHVSYPDDGSTAVVIVHGCSDTLPETLAGGVRDVLGEFVQEIIQ